VQLVVSEAAAALISERGGRLYVWTRGGRCCGASLTRLVASHEAPDAREFRQVEGGAGFGLFLPTALELLPDELHLESRRFPRRIEAYWNGCAWVT
jgi:hypothetical protein